MSIDLEKLTLAPWETDDPHDSCCGSPCTPNGCHESHPSGQIYLLGVGIDCGRFENEHDCMFIALARNAFDVMMRRGWEFRTVPGCGYCATFTTGHCVDDTWTAEGNKPTMKRFHADPFTALVEADAWYKENVERAG